MAVSAPLSGPGSQQVWLENYLVATATNASQYYWEVRYYGNGYGSWGAGPYYWSLSGFATTSGQFSIPQSQAYQTYIVLGSGYYWKTHTNGYLAPQDLVAAISTNHASIGSGSVAMTVYPPNLGTRPPAPTVVGYGFDQIGYNTARFRFSSTGDGGSPVTSWAFQLSKLTDLNDWSDAITIGSSGTTFLTADAPGFLVPGQFYKARARGQNAIGVSDWSGTATMETLPGIYVSDGVAWVPSGPRESDGTTWDDEMLQISSGSAWSTPNDV